MNNNDKLVELRKKKLQKRKEAQKQQDAKHEELKVLSTKQLEASQSLESSLKNLFSKLFEDNAYSLQKLSEQLQELKGVYTFSEDVGELEEALAAEVSQMVDAVENIDFAIDNSDILNAIDSLSEKIQQNTLLRQQPNEYLPVRRVVQLKSGQYVFDDRPTQLPTPSGGSGGGFPMAVVNEDNELKVFLVNTEQLATSDNQTNGDQRTMIVNGDNTPVSTKPVQDGIDGTEEALITHSVIQGYSTAGGGAYHDVKVTPSGALTVEAVPTKATDEYGIVAISQDATYKYFWFEKDNLDYYVMRKHIANKVFTYTAGTGGYAAVYVNPTSGPSGSPTWGSYGATF